MNLEQARALLSKWGWLDESGELGHGYPYVSDSPDPGSVILEGEFSAEELEAMGVYLRHMRHMAPR